MGEQVTSVGSFDPRPPEMAMVPIDVTEQRRFAKEVEFWSGAMDAHDAYRSAAIAQVATAEYIEGYAPHRPLNDLVQDRTGSHAGVKYEREGVTVICKSLDDLVSLTVERSVPQGSSPVDKVTRTEYVIDGLDSMTADDSADEEIAAPIGDALGELMGDEEPFVEVVETEWFVDRTTGGVFRSKSGFDVDRHVAFDRGVDVEKRNAADGEYADTVDTRHTAVIAAPKGGDDGHAFTHSRLWQAEDVFAALAAGGWQVSFVEQTIKPRGEQ